MKLRVLPVAALVLTAAIAAASAMQAVAIKWNPKEGATYKYKLAVKISGPQSFDMTGSVSTKIKSVLDEKVVVESTSEMEGMGEASTETSTMSRTGEILDTKSSQDTQGINMNRLAQTFLFIYPGNEVKEGETWIHKVKADKDKGIFSSETTFKYVGMEEVEGTKCWKITSEFKETDAPSNSTSTNTFWISVEDTEQFKAVTNAKNVDFGGMAFDLESTTTRVK
jgi:hypothetical protein